MVETTFNDPRDQVFLAARALRGLWAMLQNRASPCFGDAELANLVELIDERLYPAAMELQGYVPRGFSPQAD